VSKKVRNTAKTRPAEPPTADGVAHLLMRWTAMAMKRARTGGMPELLSLLNEHNLTMPMVVVMHVIAFEGKQTMTSLADKTQLSTSATSHLLQRLVDGGVVERTDSLADRRVKEIGLTALGSELVSAMVRQRFNDLRSSVEPLSAPALGLLAKALTRVIDELSADAEHEANAQCPRDGASTTVGAHGATNTTDQEKA